MAMLDEAIRACANETWDDIVPVLHDYIAIPNVSPVFDPDWRANGHMAEAVDLIAGWCRAQPIDGLTLEVVELDGPHAGDPDGDPGDRGRFERRHRAALRAPRQAAGDGGLARGPRPVDAGARGRSTVRPRRRRRRLRRLRQPHRDPCGACRGRFARPVRGAHRVERGVGLTRPAVLHRGAGRPRSARRASSSASIPVASTTTGCGSPRRCAGSCRARLRVDIVTDGLHSGDVSGMVPSTFRIARMLLDRVEDAQTGAILVPELTVEIPENRLREASDTAAEIGRIADHYPFVDGAGPTSDDPAEQLLSRTWRADAQRRRRRRAARHRPRRQRAAAEHVAQAVVPSSADVRSGGRPRGREGGARGRSAVRRARVVQRR